MLKQLATRILNKLVKPKHFSPQLPTPHFPTYDESRAAHDKILESIHNDRPMFGALMVNSMAELKLVLACYGLERVPEGIAPVVLLELWYRLLPNLAENAEDCFSLTDEQKTWFQDAYVSIISLTAFSITSIDIFNPNEAKEDYMKELTRRRLETLDQLYAALGISIAHIQKHL